MSFPDQTPMQRNHVRLTPVDGSREGASAVRQLVLAHADELERDLPGVLKGYSGRFSAHRRASRIAERTDAEAFHINERIPQTRLIGQASLLHTGLGIQLDYWMFPSAPRDRGIIGQQVARLLIARADEIIGEGFTDDMDVDLPHAWLYEPVDGVDRDPSREFRTEMEPTDQTQMPDSPDTTAANDRPVRLWIPKGDQLGATTEKRRLPPQLKKDA